MKTILSRLIGNPHLGIGLGPDSPVLVRSLGLAAAAAGVSALLIWAGLPEGLLLVAGIIAGAAFVRLVHPEPLSADLRSISAAEADPAERRPPDSAVLSFADALPTPILVLDATGRVAHANPAARRSLPRLAVGAHHASVIRAPEFVEAVTRTFADGEARSVAFAASPGRERVLDACLSPLPTGICGPERALVVQIEDRTEARRTEQLRSDFVANASHELRTPLASIIGFIETLQHHARDDPAARERFLAVMGREATRMQRLVDDLLSLSRIEMTEHVRPQADCAVAEIAAEAAAALVPVAAAEGVELRVALTEASPVLPGDRDQLYQVFTNLIDNAIKYAGKGAIVEVDAAPPSRAFPGRVGIRVSDTGPGIPREHLPRLTERFYRASAGQSRHKGGTGLGLAIVTRESSRSSRPSGRAARSRCGCPEGWRTTPLPVLAGRHNFVMLSSSRRRVTAIISIRGWTAHRP
jgi:two-component system phosphate regulon sensor histidine kinase PhoR